MWADPVLLATAFDITRALGRKRLGVAVLVGAFAVGLLLQVSRKRDDKSARIIQLQVYTLRDVWRPRGPQHLLENVDRER